MVTTSLVLNAHLFNRVLRVQEKLATKCKNLKILKNSHTFKTLRATDNMKVTNP
jgi:hypothetical protein